MTGRLALATTILGLVAFGAPGAAGKDRPDFWDVSMSAAADAGLDSPLPAIILGNAFNAAQKRDPQAVRTRLARLHLMLAYVAAGKYDEFQREFGKSDMKFDVSEFDRNLKDFYVPKLKDLRNSYYERFKTADRSKLSKVQLEGLEYGAKNFARLASAIRRRIASEDRIGLANDLTSEGLIFGQLGEGSTAIDRYKEALELIFDAKKEPEAIVNAENASIVGKTDVADEEKPDKQVVEAIFTLAPDEESAVPILIMRQASWIAEDAIKAGDSSSADKAIETMVRADERGRGINLLLSRKWPCHPWLATTHFWRAKLAKTRMDYKRKFSQGAVDEADKYARLAEAEYQRAMTISLFSQGGRTGPFRDWGALYVQHLQDIGREEEANNAKATIETFSASDVGAAGPEAWRHGMDCPQEAM